jgi:hypothetical protein
MRITHFGSLLALSFVLIGIVACRNKNTEATIQVVGDTSYVSSPSIIVGGLAWKETAKESDMVVGEGFKYELELLHHFFPKDSAMIAMVKTHYFALQGGSEVFSFNQTGQYIFLATKEGKVSPIYSVKQECNEIAAALGRDPIYKDQPITAPSENAPMTEQEQIEYKKKVEAEKLKKEPDSIDTSGPQLVNPNNN